MQAPKINGNAALKPYLALLLSTKMFVGPGVIEATKANSKNGSNVGKVDNMAADSVNDLRS
jgi:hypothetical protein